MNDKIIYHTKIKIGTWKEESKSNTLKRPIWLEIEIKNIYDRKKITTDHKEVTQYKTLSICGDIVNICSGQIHNEMKSKEVRLNPQTTKIKRLLTIWKRWHLNDLRPNCIHQESFNCNCGNFKEKALIQTNKCPHKYRYGSEWLLEPLPERIEKEIIELVNAIKQGVKQ